MRYFFWNTHKEKVNNILEEIMLKEMYDIVILAEYEDNIDQLMNKLYVRDMEYKNISISKDERITFITNRKNFKSAFSEQYFTIRIFKMSQDDIKIICGVHLPGQGYAEDGDRRAILQNIVEKIEELEDKYKTKRSIIIGDFNANPYENCMIEATGLHAVSSSIIAKKVSRKIKGTTYNMFYNPMWNKFGDFEGTPGTYYYRQAKVKMVFWNIFDQVIIRPQIIDKFKKESLKVVTEINGRLLFDKNNIIVGDHLPLEFEIEED